MRIQRVFSGLGLRHVTISRGALTGAGLSKVSGWDVGGVGCGEVGVVVAGLPWSTLLLLL